MENEKFLSGTNRKTVFAVLVGPLAIVPALFFASYVSSVLNLRYEGWQNWRNMVLEYPASFAFAVLFISYIMTIFFGFGIMNPYFSSVWFWVKMGFVVALIAYHHVIHFANKNLQKDKYTKTIAQLITMNQGGIIFLVSIVILAVLKDTLDYLLIIGGTAGLVLLVYIVGRAMIKRSAKQQSE